VGGRARRAPSSLPCPAGVPPGLEVAPSTVSLLSSDMAEFAMAYASLVGRHFEGPATASIQNVSSRLLILQDFLPRSGTNRHPRHTLRNKRFSRASGTTADKRARSSFVQRRTRS